MNKQNTGTQNHTVSPGRELSQAARDQLLREWNRTQAPYPRSKRIPELFEEQAQRTPEAVALVYRDQHLTYRQLNDQADALAGQLRRMGVGPEAPVGICLLRSLEMVVGLYAIHKAGGAYVPMDPGYPPERLAFMLEDTQAPVLLTQHALQNLLPPARARILCVDSLPASPETRTTSWSGEPPLPRVPGPSPHSSENLAYVIYTSGSTGKPKGVMVRHRNVVNFFSGMDKVLGKEPGVWLAVTSISFDISVLELFWTLTRGFKVVLLEDETARARKFIQPKRPGDEARYAAADQILRHGVTHLQCTPSQARLMMQDASTRAALRQVKRLLFGGEVLPPDLVQQVQGGGELLNMYGPTETTIWSTCHPVTRAGGSIAIGRPLANTTIYLLDEHFQPVPVGVAGELFIGGQGVARGY
ncbi:MAG TPA: amino acid adenylation domain-containing protein, partial [Candidatus Sulfotelmatobacter sp.]|nr:amino acid adenylation domain-containing protein [Candidatus Sulfotelmatobacter sp.]